MRARVRTTVIGVSSSDNATFICFCEIADVELFEKRPSVKIRFIEDISSGETTSFVDTAQL